jgi:hypothetical protein
MTQVPGIGVKWPGLSSQTIGVAVGEALGRTLADGVRGAATQPAEAMATTASPLARSRLEMPRLELALMA